jgi:hypothetical protein
MSRALREIRVRRRERPRQILRLLRVDRVRRDRVRLRPIEFPRLLRQRRPEDQRRDQTRRAERPDDPGRKQKMPGLPQERLP